MKHAILVGTILSSAALAQNPVATHKPVRTQVWTDLDGDPVEIKVDYSRLADGTAYPSRSVIWSTKREIRISIDSFDYVPASLQ